MRQEPPGRINEDSVGHLQISTGLGSSLGAYWPWILYQNGAGVLHHVRNKLSGDTFRPSTEWANVEIDSIRPQMSSRLAVVPTATDFGTIAIQPGHAVFYQDRDSKKLAVSITDLDSPDGPNRSSNFSQPWPTTLPDITLPEQASIVAFSVARHGDTTDRRVDTYVLHLDANGHVNVVYTDSRSSASHVTTWKTAVPAALKGADKDTDIACLTMGSSPYNAAGEDVPLEEAKDEMRCFFQRGGKVVEVRLDAGKGDWIAVGDVPIPS
ncbi:hypothetical protein C8A00DRAFT_33732 [Chaetomidium leptoderma]|uniref:Fucose-specific lectin n=1 Tax=Chaetomidium leptoderma TaxID=669021 RepID=A0AAN6ZX88_9PEZI|nr:hypothetical protein C8A00DRAFT_33732 [Chaetomidium leptoderma]